MFDTPLFSPSSALYTDRLAALRAEMKRQELDAFLIPMTDEYLNEYVPPSARRIEFLSGFTGSYAFVAVFADRAAFFTDSRYTLQSKQQIPLELFEDFDTAVMAPSAWIEKQAKSKMKIGFDPRLHTTKQIERLETALLKIGASLSPTDQNPVDVIWTDKPAASRAPIGAHEAAYAGKSSALKRQELADELGKAGLGAAVITDPSSIAWLLNVRGGDVPHAPLPLSKAILRADSTIEWFVDPTKPARGLETHLGSEIMRHDESDFPAALKRLGEARCKVLIDPDQTSFWVKTLLSQAGAEIAMGQDPCALPRACKNQTEIDGMRAAHRRDGAAIVRLLAWLDETLPQGGLTELDVEAKLTAFRAEGQLYRGPSFDTIAGSGPNGAIVHYRATETTNRTIDRDSFLLLDSGAQYLDGTTDITRTIPTGNLSMEMKDRYTRVLKGHIALSMVRFPTGTSGADIDVLARQYLWDVGCDYGHGTGHGVGSYLSVHEGPQSISRRGTASLRPGMVLSNEPGFYKARYYGIRIENLQYVVDLFEISSPEIKMLGFEPLTLVPYDRRAMDISLLSKAERDWINAYHTRVNKALRPQLDEKTAAWLTQATAIL